MKFTPRYTVSYKGVFHKAGIPFEIDDADAGKLAVHGYLERTDPAKPEQTEPVKKPGRPKKAVNE